MVGPCNIFPPATAIIFIYNVTVMGIPNCNLFSIVRCLLPQAASPRSLYVEVGLPHEGHLEENICLPRGGESIIMETEGGHRLNFAYIEDARTPDALARMAASAWMGRGWNGAPGAIRTPDLLVRSQIEPNPVKIAKYPKTDTTNTSAVR
jgi:hypothetical protein